MSIVSPMAQRRSAWLALLMTLVSITSVQMGASLSMPVIGALAGWIILSQAMTFTQMLGVGLVVCASAGVIRQQGRRGGPP